MKRYLLRSSIACLGLLAAGSIVCSAAEKPATLKDAYKDAFLIGVAVNQSQFTGQDTNGAALIKAQFNCITPEDALKWQSLHPGPGTNGYDFTAADRYVEFGEKNHMTIIGHTLVWHSQVPRWVFQDENTNDLTRDALLERMRDHIHTVVGRYKGRIKGWDVVNEALQDNGGMRNSKWFRIIGEDYVAKAFEFAHEADPAAELYYNDYALENEPKRKGAVELVKKLQAAGIRITGVGCQHHDKMDWPTVQQVEATINAFAELGVKVMVTELDMDVLSARGQNRSADVADVQRQNRPNIYTNGLPESVQMEQAKRYGDLFAVFLKHRDTVSRVTLWGLTDGDSWLSRGRVNYPLLFDRDWKPKPAFDAVIQAARATQSEATK